MESLVGTHSKQSSLNQQISVTKIARNRDSPRTRLLCGYTHHSWSLASWGSIARRTVDALVLLAIDLVKKSVLMNQPHFMHAKRASAKVRVKTELGGLFGGSRFFIEAVVINRRLIFLESSFGVPITEKSGLSDTRDIQG